MVRSISPVCAAWMLGFSASICAAQVTFVNVASDVGIDHVVHEPMTLDPPVVGRELGSGVAVADYDGDGFLDVLIVDAYGWQPQLYRNNGNGTFSNVSSQAGIVTVGFNIIPLFHDFDNDGDPDLVIGNEYRQVWGLPGIEFFENNGDGTFTDITAESGLASTLNRVSGLAAVDYDQDGLLDLYMTLIEGTDVWVGPFNYMFHNDGGLRFTEVTQDLGLRNASTDEKTWVPVFADFDGDDDQDLLVAVDFDVNYYFEYERDTDGAFQFLDKTHSVGLAHDQPLVGGNDMGLTVGDCDNDGDLDVFTNNITEEPPDEMFKTNALYINQGLPYPLFQDEGVDRGVWEAYWGWGAAFSDVDLDGDLDLYAVNGRWWLYQGFYFFDKPAQLFLNDGTCNFEDVASQAGADHVGESRAVVPFDFDNDGDEDFIITDITGPVIVYENQNDSGNHHLVLRLVGHSGARDALGSKVWVSAGGSTQFRELVSGTSFLAGPPLQMHVGVGGETIIDELRIKWYLGDEIVLPNVPVDTLLTIDELDPPQPLAHTLTISGPTITGPHSDVQFNAFGEFYFGQPDDATELAQWSIEPAGVADFVAPGHLVFGDVQQQVQAVVRATLDQATAVFPVTVLVDEVVDITQPVVTILQPSADGYFQSSEPVVFLEGTATDDLSVGSVSWSSSEGYDGTCVGTTSWMCGELLLGESESTITITAIDAAGNEGIAAITIAYVPTEAGGDDIQQQPVQLDQGLATNAQLLVFTDGKAELEFSVWSPSAVDLDYTIVTDRNWLTVAPEAGLATNVLAGGRHAVSVDRSVMSPFFGATGHITIVPADPAYTETVIDVFVAILPFEATSWSELLGDDWWPDSWGNDWVGDLLAEFGLSPPEAPTGDAPTELPEDQLVSQKPPDATDDAIDPLAADPNGIEEDADSIEPPPGRGLCGALGLLPLFALPIGLLQIRRRACCVRKRSTCG